MSFIYTFYRKKLRRRKLEFARFQVGSVILDLDPLSRKRIRIRIKADPKYWSAALEAYPRFICSFFIYKMFVKLKLVFNHTLTKLTERSNVFEKEREEHTENIFFIIIEPLRVGYPLPSLPPSTLVVHISYCFFVHFFL